MQLVGILRFTIFFSASITVIVAQSRGPFSPLSATQSSLSSMLIRMPYGPGPVGTSATTLSLCPASIPLWIFSTLSSTEFVTHAHLPSMEKNRPQRIVLHRERLNNFPRLRVNLGQP